MNQVCLRISGEPPRGMLSCARKLFDMGEVSALPVLPANSKPSSSGASPRPEALPTATTARMPRRTMEDVDVADGVHYTHDGYELFSDTITEAVTGAPAPAKGARSSAAAAVRSAPAAPPAKA